MESLTECGGCGGGRVGGGSIVGGGLGLAMGEVLGLTSCVGMLVTLVPWGMGGHAVGAEALRLGVGCRGSGMSGSGSVVRVCGAVRLGVLLTLL